ncbi:MAG: aminoacyl-tRNA hydrolase [Chitinispirillaceae bacterium]|nr:aminoacyl-tRNA hydrolase [Chitinispirillaceae bacterium]
MTWLSFFTRVLAKEARPQAVEVLFFGLGNRGEKYAATRHNIGFRVADALACRLSNRRDGRFGDADYSTGTLFTSTKALVAKPRTFMNRSGAAVEQYREAFRIPVSRMLVVVDDYQLPLGTMRARRGGSDGGHNGLASIVRTQGETFPRLRIGIGPLPQGMGAVEFVLGSFATHEEDALEAVIVRAVDACLCFAEKDIETVMNRFNR